MLDSFSRRDFIRSSSAIGLAAAALSPASAFAAPTQKSRVVIAKDTSCLTSSSAPDKAKIQDMLDNAIMTLTGKSDKGQAYEALFTNGVKETTKIAIKKNDLSGSHAVNNATVEMLTNSLTSMLGGKFPKGNITLMNQNKSWKTTIEASDYIINCPIAYCHSVYSVTLSLKNTMGYLNDPQSIHSNAKTWLHTNSLNAAIKPKQMLTILDAIVGNCNNGPGPGVKTNFTAHTIIVSRDLVAADYNALRIMEIQSSANKTRIATGDQQLKDAEKAGLGTCTPANMEIIEISPPWNKTGIEQGSDSAMKALNIQVANHGNKVEFSVPTAQAHGGEIGIYDMAGKLVWHAREIATPQITWNTNATPAGMYAYRIKTNGSLVKGVVLVSE
ncbi:MAG: DUF362 domain-containing protein [Chitinivibrionales bacterium]|nr:DUF362 domain-containing protein [Chitinivibrionales bacterium]